MILCENATQWVEPWEWSDVTRTIRIICRCILLTGSSWLSNSLICRGLYKIRRSSNRRVICSILIVRVQQVSSHCISHSRLFRGKPSTQNISTLFLHKHTSKSKLSSQVFFSFQLNITRIFLSVNRNWNSVKRFVFNVKSDTKTHFIISIELSFSLHNYNSTQFNLTISSKSRSQFITKTVHIRIQELIWTWNRRFHLKANTTFSNPKFNRGKCQVL